MVENIVREFAFLCMQYIVFANVKEDILKRWKHEGREKSFWFDVLKEVREKRYDVMTSQAVRLRFIVLKELEWEKKIPRISSCFSSHHFLPFIIVILLFLFCIFFIYFLSYSVKEFFISFLSLWFLWLINFFFLAIF